MNTLRMGILNVKSSMEYPHGFTQVAASLSENHPKITKKIIRNQNKINCQDTFRLQPKNIFNKTAIVVQGDL